MPRLAANFSKKKSTSRQVCARLLPEDRRAHGRERAISSLISPDTLWRLTTFSRQERVMGHPISYRRSRARSEIETRLHPPPLCASFPAIQAEGEGHLPGLLLRTQRRHLRAERGGKKSSDNILQPSFPRLALVKKRCFFSSPLDDCTFSAFLAPSILVGVIAANRWLIGRLLQAGPDPESRPGDLEKFSKMASSSSSSSSSLEPAKKWKKERSPRGEKGESSESGPAARARSTDGCARAG